MNAAGAASSSTVATFENRDETHVDSRRSHRKSVCGCGFLCVLSSLLLLIWSVIPFRARNMHVIFICSGKAKSKNAICAIWATILKSAVDLGERERQEEEGARLMPFSGCYIWADGIEIRIIPTESSNH